MISRTRKLGAICPRDSRRVRYFLDYLPSKNIRVSLRSAIPTVEEMCSCISQALAQSFPRVHDREQFIKTMEQDCDSVLVPERSFEWFKNDDRACFWVWALLRTAQPQFLGYSKPVSPTPLMYDQLNLDKYPTSTSDRFSSIVDFFDFWPEGPSMKAKLLEHLKFNWTQIYNGADPFKWLNHRDGDQCDWAWKYVSKYDMPTWHLSPINNKEKHLAIYAAFDAWIAPQDTRRLFSINIGKAWSQKKHRDKMEGKKPLNSYLNVDTKKKLDELAKYHDKKIHAMLESMIEGEYARTFYSVSED